MNELPFLVTQIMNLHFGPVPVVDVNLSLVPHRIPQRFPIQRTNLTRAVIDSNGSWFEFVF